MAECTASVSQNPVRDVISPSGAVASPGGIPLRKKPTLKFQNNRCQTAVTVVTLPDCLESVCKPQPCLDSFSPYTVDLERYYQTENEDENPFICSQPRENGMRYCRSIPTRREEGLECTLDYYSYNDTTNTSCVNWNQYYTNCSAGEHNPFKGAINFDNIGYAWIAIFQVSLVCKLSRGG